MLSNVYNDVSPIHKYTSNPRHYVPQEDGMGEFLAAGEACMAIIILTPSRLFTEVTFDNSGFSSEGHIEHIAPLKKLATSVPATTPMTKRKKKTSETVIRNLTNS